MSDRERRIETIAIMKSMIESGMNVPGEEFDITLQQHLKCLDRHAGSAPAKSTPVFNQPQTSSNGGGAYELVDSEEKGKYLRVQLMHNGVKQWCSAWDQAADALRGVAPGQMLDCKIVEKGNFKNVKDVKFATTQKVEADNIPF